MRNPVLVLLDVVTPGGEHELLMGGLFERDFYTLIAPMYLLVLPLRARRFTNTTASREEADSA